MLFTIFLLFISFKSYYVSRRYKSLSDSFSHNFYKTSDFLVGRFFPKKARETKTNVYIISVVSITTSLILLFDKYISKALWSFIKKNFLIIKETFSSFFTKVNLSLYNTIFQKELTELSKGKEITFSVLLIALIVLSLFLIYRIYDTYHNGNLREEMILDTKGVSSSVYDDVNNLKKDVDFILNNYKENLAENHILFLETLKKKDYIEYSYILDNVSLQSFVEDIKENLDVLTKFDERNKLVEDGFRIYREYLDCLITKNLITSLDNFTKETGIADKKHLEYYKAMAGENPPENAFEQLERKREQHRRIIHRHQFDLLDVNKIYTKISNLKEKEVF